MGLLYLVLKYMPPIVRKNILNHSCYLRFNFHALSIIYIFNKKEIITSISFKLITVKVNKLVIIFYYVTKEKLGGFEKAFEALNLTFIK